LAVHLGIDTLTKERKVLLKGRRFGLISHHAAVDSGLKETLKRLREEGLAPYVLLAPEHGYDGLLEAGETFESRFDRRIGIRVKSLYRGIQGLAEGLDADGRMRALDTLLEGKSPSQSELKGLEALVFDLVDVGTRVYTYLATLVIALKASLEANIPIFVLDRPNPVGGHFEGPVLEPGYESFVGILPVALRHGMTLGELALFANERLFQARVPLHVVPLEGWSRSMPFEQTGLFWAPPSPNMPTLTTALVYPGQVLFEGTNVSEGRGTTAPFELIGAPWISADEFAGGLEKVGLPGVRFKPWVYRPAFSKYAGGVIEGIRLFVEDKKAFSPFKTTVALLLELKRLYPDKLVFHEHYFDRVAGNGWLRPMIEKGASLDEILGRCQEGLAAFQTQRRPFLLYAEV